MSFYYKGNGAYCYSSSVSMLLSVIGEDISPSLVEVTTGFSLGASLERNNMLFFDNGLSSPDKGVNLAFRTLGFSVVEQASSMDEEMPIERLKCDLEVSPVMLGPLDMGHLTYLPNHQFLGGCDHYVLVVELRDNEVLIHDPAGYPYVWLSVEQLEKAWKAENIPWSSGAYRYWKTPKRRGFPSDDEIYDQSIQLYKDAYEKQRIQPKFGGEAILLKAKQLLDSQISNEEKGHLTHFAFPLGSRRAIDFSHFFKERNGLLSSLKEEQAKLFGKCYTCAASQKWIDVAASLHLLADTEFKFEETLLNEM
ncbi:hypothetical protein ABEV54_22260 [Peribacillus psychrosaccharolyticus]|uniref:hypothetical protein n=1 Tax=Peribacillus psychrosaccharolyticus TaxID=1407 RepID=UPI003D2662A2